MATEYYFTRNGQQLGPVSAAALKHLAALGRLCSNDCVWKEGLADWVPAARIKGLFPGGGSAEAVVPPWPNNAAIVAELPQPLASAAKPDRRPDRMPADAIPVLEAAEAPDGTDAGRLIPESQGNYLGSNASLPSPQPEANSALQLQPRGRPGVRGLGSRPPVILVAIGLVCITFLAFSSLLPWESYEYGPGIFRTRETTRGIGVVEGKLVSLLALASAAAVGFGLFLKRLLPAAILAGAATGTCSVVLTLSMLLRILRYFAATRENLEYLTQITPMADDFIKSLGGGARFGLYLAMLTALVAAGAFVMAGLRRPLELAWIERAGGGMLMQKYGPLLITQALAVLIGIVVFVIQY